MLPGDCQAVGFLACQLVRLQYVLSVLYDSAFWQLCYPAGRCTLQRRVCHCHISALHGIVPPAPVIQLSIACLPEKQGYDAMREGQRYMTKDSAKFVYKLRDSDLVVGSKTGWFLWY